MLICKGSECKAVNNHSFGTEQTLLTSHTQPYNCLYGSAEWRNKSSCKLAEYRRSTFQHLSCCWPCQAAATPATIVAVLHKAEPATECKVGQAGYRVKPSCKAVVQGVAEAESKSLLASFSSGHSHNS